MLPKRFRRARRVVLEIDGVTVDAFVAERYGLRLRGLSGLRADELVPLLITRCRSIHTFGMRAPIDVVWIATAGGEDRAIVGVTREVRPGRMVRAPGGASRRRTDALELPIRR